MEQNVITLIAVIGTLSGIALGWTGKARTVKQDTIADASRDATLQADLSHIKRGIEDLRVDIKVQGQRYDVLQESVIRMDESLKSAHKRIDKLEARP